MPATLVPAKNNKVFYGIVLCVLLLVVWEVITKIAIKAWVPGISLEWQMWVSRLLFWLYILGLWLYAAKVEKQPLLLWANRAYPVKFWVYSIGLLLLAYIAGTMLIATGLRLLHMALQSTLTKEFLRLSLAIKIFTALTAGICEELIFRGFLQSRLQLFFKGKWWPIVISAFIFGMGHAAYGTVINTVAPMLLGVLFGWYYHRYRNITTLIVCHFLIDFTLLVLVGGNR